MSLGALILTILAVFRVSWMVVREEGPFGAFVYVREHIDRNQEHWTGRGLNCVNCVSFWLALLLVWMLGGSWLEWLAVAGAVVLINKAMLK